MSFNQRAKHLVSLMTIEEKISQLSHDAPEIDRLSIQAYNHWNEGLHGVARAGLSTVFPQAIGLAATFNPTLIKKMATIIGIEARAKYNIAKTHGASPIYQGITLWSPNVNIFRDPRWGRGQETYGEDPLLTTKMGTMFVKGIQRRNHQGYRLADATIKHFYAHSGPESLRHRFNATISLRDQAETYFYAFKEIIKNASPAGVMGAYNRVNDEPPCGSEYLINDVLRKRFGFKGYVVSDCWAINDFHQGHKVTNNPLESAVKAIKAGCDLSCGDSYQHLYEAYQRGLIDEEIIDERLIRLYESRFRLGMFDHDCIYHEISPKVIHQSSHQKINRKLSGESIILLKNEGLLPLNENIHQKIAIIGHNANNLSAIYGNYHGTPEYQETIYQGLCNAYPKMNIRYAQGSFVDHNPQPWEFQPLNEAKDVALWADVIILVLGIDSTIEGEENDASKSLMNGDKSTLNYLSHHIDLISTMRLFNKPMILINVSGSALIFPTDPFQAIIQQFYGGAYAGRALAHVLWGKTNPSGHLPITFYGNEDELPPFEEYSMTQRTYKYFKGTILYPFGSGLSYSHYTVDVISCTLNTCDINVSNQGPYRGYPVVFVYASYPNQQNSPRYNLVGFEKIAIEINQTKRFKIQLSNIKLYDFEGKLYLPNNVLLHISLSHPDNIEGSITYPMLLKRS